MLPLRGAATQGGGLEARGSIVILHVRGKICLSENGRPLQDWFELEFFVFVEDSSSQVFRGGEGAPSAQISKPDTEAEA
jgi:hypothetical protein